jgi:hypothetical protein
MKKLSLTLTLALTLVACGKEEPISKETLKCGDFEVSAAVYENKVIATIGGEDIEMKPGIAASGIRYEGSGQKLTGVVLLNRGRAWAFILNDGDPIDCSVVTEGDNTDDVVVTE